MKFNGKVCDQRFKEILAYLGINTKGLTKTQVVETFVELIKKLSASVGVTQTIADYGCKKEDIEMLSKKAMEDPCKPGNPRETELEDFIKLYKEAMKG